MSIHRIRLKNFKCFSDSGDIPLAPLTIIFGRNNTGKSSILQSLLLLRQTLDSPESGPRLELRGPLYRAGGYADIVHQHRASENIVMEFDVGTAKANGTVVLEFASDEPQPARLVRLTIEPSSFESLAIQRTQGRGGPYKMAIGDRSIGLEREAVFRFPENGFFPLIGPEPPRVGRPNAKNENARDSAREVLRTLENSLRSMRAVGAFRSQPDRRYEYQGRSSPAMDVTGRSVIDALIEDSTRRGSKRGELIRAVNRWLKVVGRVRIKTLKRISRTARLYEIHLRDTDSGRWANYADVGFGIGQALPVLVEGLRTDPGAMFLVQEPEIHLHPDAQLAMADFLVSLAASGVRVLVETHSENLLLRIRKRILVPLGSRSQLNHDDIKILYVDKRKEGFSRVTPLAIDSLGQIGDWPPGFMEEATDERMSILDSLAGMSEGGQ